ncbi:uncharacterized protein ELE39_002928 [Cryptosporidium sp. chipmunk genotype I]|uniref:uncharacterized protein n=1 Tax=Cryptosporidium sp. chipmunk genotype I TaxID=1280935 RepID=UPI00351A4F81|nr:hypothetical protein ELE39_002928 [Cryptosporidium sp. chipmunk genotype I]
MSILVDGQALSVTDLFKKYDLDEISDILVKVKKEVFVRTNEVKKVIGSNPDLMIDFGENVLNIYTASTKLNSSTFELLNDIEKFSNSLSDRVSNFIHEELPDVIRKEDLNSILSQQEQHERIYFGILESFSKKSFVQSYELYLKYKQLVGKDPPDLENHLFNNSFFKQSISSNCYTFIQSCEKLTSIELAQLIVIRYLMEIEDKHADHSEYIDSEFKKILETALILRVDETIRNLKHARITDSDDGHEDNIGSNEERDNRLSQTFMIAMTVLVDLYELKESILLVFSEFKQKGWCHFQSFDHMSTCILPLNNSNHISRLLSVLLEEFESMGKEKADKTSHIENDDTVYNKKTEKIKQNFRFRFLSRIYLNVFNEIKHGLGIEILRSSFFPILISTIEEDLLAFLINENKKQLMDLILRSGEDIESCCNEKIDSVFEDHDTIKWLISKDESFEILLDEIKETGKLLDKIEPSEKNSILRCISEKCFGSVINKFIEFNRVLLWSIKGKDFKQIPDIIIRDKGDPFANIHEFSNILIQGKRLEVLESYLIEYLSTDQEEPGFSFQSLTQDFNVGIGNVSWRILVRVCNEISASIEDYSEDTQTFMLSSLGEFAKSYISSECLVKHIQNIKTLSSILYSLMIHREYLSQKICTYQSLLQKTISSLTDNCFNNEETLPLTSLYRQFDFAGDNSVTPHTLLLEFCFELNMIAAQLASKTQKSTFDLVCGSYIKAYILPFQTDIIKAFSDLYFKLEDPYQGDEGSNKKLKDNKELIVRSVSCLYADLLWCTRFSVCNNSVGQNNKLSGLDSPGELSSTIDIVKTILNSENLISIENGVFKLLKEAQEDYDLETCHQLPKVQDLFANNVQRFPTLPLVKSSSRGSISNKITIANDKTLKANIDSNSVSSNNDYSQFLLTHYSDILKNYNKSDSIRIVSKVSSVVNSQESINNISNFNTKDEKVGGWFSMSSGQQNGESSSSIHSNDNNAGSFINNNGPGVMGINKKIDAQAIWQVSNLLKETVKDKVFGQ